jgi:hypothetical protein
MVNGKVKGASYERALCVLFSLWISHGQRKDIFWRSSLSGGRATVHKKGEVRQAGDMCAVAPEGHILTDQLFFEFKHVRDLQLDRFFLEGKGTLAKFWRTAHREALKYNRLPLIIARQNRLPTLIVGPLNPVFSNLANPHAKVALNGKGHQFSYGDVDICQVALFDQMLKRKFQTEWLNP